MTFTLESAHRRVCTLTRICERLGRGRSHPTNWTTMDPSPTATGGGASSTSRAHRRLRRNDVITRALARSGAFENLRGPLDLVFGHLQLDACDAAFHGQCRRRRQWTVRWRHPALAWRYLLRFDDGRPGPQGTPRERCWGPRGRSPRVLLDFSFASLANRSVVATVGLAAIPDGASRVRSNDGDVADENDI